MWSVWNLSRGCQVAEEKELTPEEASELAAARMTWHPEDVTVEDPEDDE